MDLLVLIASVVTDGREYCFGCNRTVCPYLYLAEHRLDIVQEFIVSNRSSGGNTPCIAGVPFCRGQIL